LCPDINNQSDETGVAMTEQASIRCVVMRGGTSKGLYLRDQDLPAAGVARDALLLRLRGSPDVLQIDGLGGSLPITSKIAIVAVSPRPDADVDYTFAQVAIESARVGYEGNCGNISAGVGPFAIDEGMIESPRDGVAEVRIWNTNTEKLLIASVPVRAGKAAVTGDFEIPGVPGTGAEIIMNWVGTVGAKTGCLLPTGAVVDKFEMETGQVVAGTLCDAGNPVLWVSASDLGMTGSELSERINSDAALIERVRELRGKAAVTIGLCADWRRVDTEAPGLPMVGMVAAADDYTTPNGRPVHAADMDLRARLIFLNRLHESMAGTGSMSLAGASAIPGSVVEATSTRRRPGQLFIGHPSGVMAVRVEAHPSNDVGGVTLDVLGMSRTARRLMEGSALYPTGA
jgi:2-methylaconitate cis-trans-isomerase PrpF